MSLSTMGIDTIVFTIRKAIQTDLSKYFRSNGYLVIDDKYSKSKQVLSSEKKELKTSENIVIAKIREDRHRHGVTTRIEFYGFENYYPNDMREKYDGYKLFYLYAQKKRYIEFLKIKEIHIDIDLKASPEILLDVTYRQGRGQPKAVNTYNYNDFVKGESYYLNKIYFYRLLYKFKENIKIEPSTFQSLYNTILDECDSEGLYFERMSLKESKSFQKDLLDSYKRYKESLEIKNIIKRYRHFTVQDRIYNIPNTLIDLKWNISKNKIDGKKTKEFILKNHQYNSYFDDSYIYIQKLPEIRCFLDELNDKLSKHNSKLVFNQSKSNDLIIYNKAIKENLSYDLIRFEFKLRLLNNQISFSSYTSIIDEFLKMYNKLKLTFNNYKQHKLYKQDELIEELDKYFKLDIK